MAKFKNQIKPTVGQSIGAGFGGVMLIAGIATLPSDYKAIGASLAIAGLVGLLWSLSHHIIQLRKFSERLQAGPLQARRIAANHFDYFRELHGDFGRQYVPGISDENRTRLRNLVIKHVHDAHDDLNRIDKHAADFFIDGKDVDALELDQRQTARMIKQKMDRLKDIKDNWD